MSEPAIHPSALIDQSAVLLRGLDLDARCNYVNQAWTRFTGRSASAEYGDGWTAAIHPDDRPEALAAILRDFKRRTPFDLEYRLLRHDGAYRWVIDRGLPVRAPGGFGGFVATSLDVHDRREAATAQKAVLRVVAAQLRTPLQAARVLTELARRACVTRRVPDASIFGKLDEQFERIHEMLWHLSFGEGSRRTQQDIPRHAVCKTPVAPTSASRVGGAG